MSKIFLLFLMYTIFFGLACRTSEGESGAVKSTSVGPVKIQWPPPESAALAKEIERPLVPLNLKMSTIFPDAAEARAHWQPQWGPVAFYNPTSAMLLSLQNLLNDGFPIYLSVADSQSAKSWTALENEKTATYLEIRKDNPNLFDDLQLDASSKVKVITPRTFVDRWDIRRAYQQFGADKIHAVTTHLPIDYKNTLNYWHSIDILYDTFFDLPQDISGLATDASGKEFKIDYPWDARLVFSTDRNHVPDSKRIGHLTGILSSMVVTYAQAMEKDLNARKKEEEKKAEGKPYSKPSKSRAVVDIAIINRWVDLNDDERYIFKIFAEQVSGGGILHWPWAWVGNGDPWSNAYLPSSNTMPFIGVIIETEGNYFVALSNVSDQPATSTLIHRRSAAEQLEALALGKEDGDDAGPKLILKEILYSGPRDQVDLPEITIDPQSVVILNAVKNAH